ncbi:MAG: YARHG domain-containing protein [Deltaproteobacteria bacterium]|nr:YARHG domain-containing protein [Deltaproteobacteria bacterium]
MPYALAGRPFTSPELTTLFHGDGGWYKPGSSQEVTIKPEHAECVTRLQKREDELRRSAPMNTEVEMIFLRDPKIFHALRSTPKSVYKVTNPGTRKGQQWTWSAMDIAPGSCGEDGSPSEREDCAGITISCELPTATADLHQLECEVIQSG